MVRGLFFIRRFCCWLLLTASLLFSNVAFAGTVTDIYDQPTSSVVGEGSNHKFVITVTSGVDEGDTLTLTFPSGFNTALITEDDLDISDDGVDLTTEGNCSGSEQASAIGVAGNIIMFTICAGDGGAIAAGSTVIVRIGTNATGSGSGTDRILNPSAAATYSVTLGGTFGDSGSVPLVIVTRDASGVSGSVPVASGGGGDDEDDDDGGGGCGSCGIADPVPDSDPAPTDPDPTTPTDPVTPETPVTPTTPTGPGTGGTTPDSGTPSSPGSSSPSTPTSPGGGSTPTTTPVDPAAPTDAPVDGGTTVPDPAVSGVTTILVTDGGLTLTPNADTFSAIADSLTTIDVVIDTSVPIASVHALVNGNEYVLVPTANGYGSDITIPGADTSVVVEITYEDGATDRQTYYIDVRANGLAYEVVENARLPVQGATITVYELRSGSRVVWDASLYGGQNPITSESGVFAWYVPNGTYVVTVEKDGYVGATSSQITVRDHILAPSIVMQRIVVVTDSEVPSETPVEVLTDIRQLPAVQTAAAIAVPVIAILAVTSLVVLASSFSLLPFLQYLFTAPILFFARRKRKAFGTVYNAATKLPIDLAIIRVFSMPEHRLVRSVVTDQQGKYLLTIAPGTYRLEVIKQKFVAPSVIVQGRKEDGQYLDVYSGQDIVVSEQDTAIAVNIPMDPVESGALVLPRHIRTKNFFRHVQRVVAVTGILLSLAVLIITPSWFTAVMAFLQILVYFFVRRLTRVRKPKGWGIVYNKISGQPVGNAVVRLFEPTYNKLIETVLTDRFGRYAFLVGPSEYYVSYSKQGYTDKLVKPIDYRNQQEPSALALDVPIEKST